jgi:hypothetical protein
VISRTLVIALALGAAVFRAAQGAWVEAGGLASLGVGLIVLAIAPCCGRSHGLPLRSPD